MIRLKTSGRPHPEDKEKTLETCPVPACGKESSMPPKGIEDENHIVCPYCETEMIFIYKVGPTKNQRKRRRKK